MKVDIHIPQQEFWGSAQPMTLKRALALGTRKNVVFRVLDTPVPDGLNNYEATHPDRAVLFDVETEDLIAVEEDPHRDGNDE